jgi:hypothetical protein
VTAYSSLIPSIQYGGNESEVQRWGQIGAGGAAGFLAASYRLSRLVSAVASQGSILQISAPYPNCSYVVEFHGPSLSCGLPTFGNSSLQDEVTGVINIANCGVANDTGCGGVLTDYVAFVPTITGKLNDTLTDWALYGLNLTLASSSSLDAGSAIRTLDTVSPDHGRFFFLVPQPDSFTIANKTFECGLYNTSYAVNFTFSNGQQDIKVMNSTRLNGVPIVLEDFSSSNACAPGTSCYGPAMAYASVLDAVGKMLVGYLTYSHYGVVSQTYTQISNTVLMETMEMQQVSNITGGPQRLSIANISMSDALEQLVTNITLSLFSDSYFL